MQPPTPATSREAAIAYAELGFAVLPFAWLTGVMCSCGCRDVCCRRRGKHPHPQGVPEGRRGSSNLDRVRTWWDLWPEANVGLDCGRSGLLVLDVDPRKGGDASLAELHSLVGDAALRTTTAETSSGGRHLYFRVPAASRFKTLRNWPLPGIDTLSEGLSVTAPPSVHPSGFHYLWADGMDPWTLPPIPLPEAIERLLHQPPPLTWRVDQLRYSLPNLELRCRVRNARRKLRHQA